MGSSGLLGACTGEQAARIIEDESTLTPNISVRIGSDDTITIRFPATEMGRGSSTSLPVILADEMDAE
jgi:isoquinoline 1-oxidoreductase beta subunit